MRILPTRHRLHSRHHRERRPAMLILSALAMSIPTPITITVRRQAEQPAGTWKTVAQKISLNPQQTAIVICDMWDKHWCASATRRCGEIAKRMEPVLES